MDMVRVTDRGYSDYFRTLGAHHTSLQQEIL